MIYHSMTLQPRHVHFLHAAARGLILVVLSVLISSCVSISDEDARVLNWDGHLCAQMVEDHEQAIKHCNRAIESTELTQDDLVATLTNRGWHFSKLGQLARALADYSRAIKIGESSTAYYNRGALYERLGDRTRARLNFERAYELAPELESIREKAIEYNLLN